MEVHLDPSYDGIEGHNKLVISHNDNCVLTFDLECFVVLAFDLEF